MFENGTVLKLRTKNELDYSVYLMIDKKTAIMYNIIVKIKTIIEIFTITRGGKCYGKFIACI